MTQLGTLMSAMLVGMTIGCIAWSGIPDRIGRRRSIIISLALYGLFSALSAAAPSYAALCLLRFISGLCASGMLVVTFPLFEELLPVRSRGRYTVYLAAGWPVGMLVAVTATATFLPIGWRAVLAVSSAASLWLFAIIRWVPESPYWLAMKGDNEAARRALLYLSAGKLSLPPGMTFWVERPERSARFEIFRGKLLPLTLLQMGVNISLSWANWGLLSWLPTLLKQRGLSLSQSYTFIEITAISMIPGYILASFLTSRYGRKWIFIILSVLTGAASFGFAFSYSLTDLYVWNFAVLFFNQGVWGIWDTWVNELYATRVRVAANSWGILAQRVASALAPALVVMLVARPKSFDLAILAFDAGIIAAAICASMLPETEGRDLE
jgi:putative MFS transporter